MKTLALILIALFIASCTETEPVTPEYLSFACVQDEPVPGQVCYFQVSIGDSVSGDYLINPDTTFLVGATGTAPRDIDITPIHGKYCQMYCFYIDGCYQFLPCCMFATVGTTSIYESCTNGISRVFWIN